MGDNTKAAMVAAVAAALKYKERRPEAKDDEIISHVMRVSSEILKKHGLNEENILYNFDDAVSRIAGLFYEFSEMGMPGLR